MPARFTVSRRYSMPAAQHFAAVCDLDELRQAMAGRMTYEGLPGGPVRQGQRIEVRLKMFGWLPVGSWRMEVVERDDAALRLVSHEGGGAVKHWRHELQVTAEGSGCVHEDRLEIEAGWLTGLYARMARRMYEDRHSARARARGDASF